LITIYQFIYMLWQSNANKCNTWEYPSHIYLVETVRHQLWYIRWQNSRVFGSDDTRELYISRLFEWYYCFFKWKYGNIYFQIIIWIMINILISHKRILKIMICLCELIYGILVIRLSYSIKHEIYIKFYLMIIHSVKKL
jgi:hypothetical protein